MPVQVSCEVSVFQYGNDRRDQILLHRILPPSHILPMSAKGLSISFNPVKVCSAEHACIRKPDINFLGLYKLAQAFYLLLQAFTSLCKFEKDKKSPKSLCQVS